MNGPRETTLPRLIYALGIPGIGIANAKVICRAFGSDPEKVRTASPEELDEIDGIGEVLARGWVSWWQRKNTRRNFSRFWSRCACGKRRRARRKS